jgi:hypothetical protein
MESFLTLEALGAIGGGLLLMVLLTAVFLLRKRRGRRTKLLFGLYESEQERLGLPELGEKKEAVGLLTAAVAPTWRSGKLTAVTLHSDVTDLRPADAHRFTAFLTSVAAPAKGFIWVVKPEDFSEGALTASLEADGGLTARVFTTELKVLEAFQAAAGNPEGPVPTLELPEGFLAGTSKHMNRVLITDQTVGDGQSQVTPRALQSAIGDAFPLPEAYGWQVSKISSAVFQVEAVEASALSSRVHEEQQAGGAEGERQWLGVTEAFLAQVLGVSARKASMAHAYSLEREVDPALQAFTVRFTGATPPELPEAEVVTFVRYVVTLLNAKLLSEWQAEPAEDDAHSVYIYAVH